MLATLASRAAKVAALAVLVVGAAETRLVTARAERMKAIGDFMLGD